MLFFLEVIKKTPTWNHVGVNHNQINIKKLENKANIKCRAGDLITKYVISARVELTLCILQSSHTIQWSRLSCSITNQAIDTEIFGETVTTWEDVIVHLEFDIGIEDECRRHFLLAPCQHSNHTRSSLVGISVLVSELRTAIDSKVTELVGSQQIHNVVMVTITESLQSSMTAVESCHTETLVMEAGVEMEYHGGILAEHQSRSDWNIFGRILDIARYSKSLSKHLGKTHREYNRESNQLFHDNFCFVCFVIFVYVDIIS